MIKILLIIKIVVINCLLIISNLVFAEPSIIEKSNSQQVFHRGNYDEPDTLDPQKAFAAPDYNILQDLYEGLTTFDENGEVILGQAKSYTISQDYKKYTFKLKDNLKWSNGDDLTAHDFEYGIKRALNPDTGSSNYILLKSIKNSEKVLNNILSINQLGVKALDKKTLEIQLEEPIPYLLNLLTHNTFMPVYKQNIEKYGDKFTNPNIYVTNGPFKLSEWVVNSHLGLVKNENYIDNSKVKLDKVIFYPINQPSIELKRYRSGDLDYTAKIPVENVNWVKNKLGKELYANNMLAAYYYSFNVTKPPFKDNPNLRKALSLTINKDIIANKILGGDRMATDRFVPQILSDKINPDAQPSCTDGDHYNKNLELAEKLYNQAGYDRKNPLKVKLLYHTNESNKVIATAVASMWKKALGVQTELVDQEWKVYLKTRLEKQDTQVFREGWIASYDDPTAFLDLFTSNNPQNSSGYNNKYYDNLLKSANLENNKSKRNKLLKQAEDVLLADAPVVPIYSPVSYHLVKPYIGGLNISKLDSTLDKYIYIKNNHNNKEKII